MLPRPATAAAVSLALLAGLAACGNSRTPAPSLSAPAAPSSFRPLADPAAGVALAAPTNWSVLQQRPPLLMVISSGAAVIALWRFQHRGPWPSDPALLAQARAALIGAVHARDRTLQLIRSKIGTVNGVHSIELDAFERIGNSVRRVRSTHLYVTGAEVVLDEYAPPRMFHSVDHAVFSPVKRSLRVVPTAA